MRDTTTMWQTGESDSTLDGADESTQAGSKWQGRGGAGNYVPDASQSSQSGQRSGPEKTQLDPRIMADVENGLQKPDKAYLGPKD